MLKETKLTKKIIKAICIFSTALTVFFIGKHFIFYYTHIPFPLHNSKKASNFVKRDGKKLLLFSKGTWKEFSVSGVTLEDTTPGGLPVTYDMYMIWFSMIHEMNANTIQAKELMESEFYRAFHDYNMKSKEPLYLVQGITLEDQVLNNMIDGFSGNLEKLLKEKAYQAIDTVHGSIKTRGNSYAWDVSDWTLGYIVGADWDQDLVIYTNDVSREKSGYSGKYISTWPTASAFETILAKVGDHIFSYETYKYGQQRLLGYGNWARTDPLFHDSSWSVGLYENLGSINMELITTHDTIKSGIFAAYHIEPNYPQFLSFDPAYSKFVDEYGKNNPYKGYLEALNKYHKLPVIVSGFGVPTSRGISNIDEVRRFNQGGINEKEQGTILKVLYKDIMDAQLAGGFIINWSDKWNETAWNTKNAVDTNRSAYWSDAQTSTQSYGLLAFEPGKQRSISYVDGEIYEWDKVKTVTEKDGNKLQMMYDEKYIYLHVKLNNDYLTGDTVYIPLDITPKSGTKKDTTNELSYDRNMDFVIVIDGSKNSKVLVQQYYNNIYSLYGEEVGKENIYIDSPNKDIPKFELIKQLSRQSMYDEKGKIRKAVFKDVGILRCGNSNPDGKNYDSLADFMILGSNIEIRIPWALLNFSDPSKMMVHDDYYKNYGVKFMSVKEIFAALTIKSSSKSKIVQAPSGRLELTGWGNSPKWHTRLKKSYYDVQEIFSKYKSDR